jgi:hypothetical protein
MNIYNVGLDELGLGSLQELADKNKFDWLVYSYCGGDWEGDGQAILLGKDGFLYTTNLGHCSCHGPEDGFYDLCRMTIEEFLREKDSIFDFECKDAVGLKVRELLAQR